MKSFFIFLIFSFLASSCVFEKGETKVDIKNRINSAKVTSISIVNNQLLVSGNNLTAVEGLKVNGVSFSELFTIESKSNNQIVANVNRAMSFDVLKIFELVLSDAYASATFPISFTGDWNKNGTSINYTAGNVGIGTTSPAYELQIVNNSGSATVGIESAAGSSSRIKFREGGSTHWNMGSSSGLNGSFFIEDGAGTDALIIDKTTGFVAIGPDDASPNALLHVVKDQDSTTELRIDNTNAGTSIDHTAVTFYDGSTLEGFLKNNNNSHLLSLGQNRSSGEVALFSGGTETLRLSDSGNVGIGTTIPGYKLDVVGGVNATLGYTQVSDIRLKTNIDYLSSSESLKNILSLRGIHFDWKDQNKYEADKQIGLIAQDVKKVFPEAVKKNADGFLSVSYSNLVAPIIESVKELYKRLVSHDEKIAKLEKENRELKARLERIEKTLK